MKLATVVTLCRAFETAGLAFWIDGGWGVDALLGEQTRPHSDLDLAIHLADAARFEALLGPMGYARIFRPGDPTWNWVLRHPTDGMIDMHGFVLDDRGNGVLGDPDDDSMYPAVAFDGVGRLGDMTVKCIAAGAVLMFRNGFQPRPVDRHDVALLCERFHMDLPSGFRAD